MNRSASPSGVALLLIERCLPSDSPGGDRVRRLEPRPADDFVIKPYLSGYLATSLAILLPRLGVRRLVLAGVATDICILFTAADAHMRDYRLWVPEDAVAAEGDDRTGWALAIMEKCMEAEVRPTTALSRADWLALVADEPPADRAERS